MNSRFTHSKGVSLWVHMCEIAQLICFIYVGGHTVDNLPRNYQEECRPIISDSTPFEIGIRQLECGISSCSNVFKIVYEKTGQIAPVQWTPVFEGINKTQYHALGTNNNYTLESRIDYTAFRTKAMLYIRPFLREDQGQWRCIAYIANNITHGSNSLDVNIYVTPEKKKIRIMIRNPLLVTHQQAELSCIADGIHPVPNVVWNLNGNLYRNGTILNSQHDDGLWFINNSIMLRFGSAGFNRIGCIIRTNNRDPWLQLNITIDVKESAIVSDPLEKQRITANTNSTYTLNCIGSGYKPNIAWTRDGHVIERNDTKHVIEEMCDDATCIGSITSHYDGLTCLNKGGYAAVFTCVISLQPPYQSKHISPFMIISLPQKLCEGRKLIDDQGLIVILPITMSVVVVICVVISATVIFIACCRSKNISKSGQPCDSEISSMLGTPQQGASGMKRSYPASKKITSL